MLPNNVYDTSSKVIAVVASPWVVILIALVFIFSLYVFYYRPRLYYPYPSYPSSPAIYFLPPWKRIRDFNRNPIQYLLTAVSKTSHLGMIWIDVVKPYTCLSIILPLESCVGNQFLLTDESVLSWDAALRQNWRHIFKDSKQMGKIDNFGRRSRFSKASNLCLAHAFSPSRTNIGGHYYSCIASEALVALSHNASNSIDLRRFIDSIVSRALLSIFFGSYESDYEHILQLINTIHKSLEKSHSYDSNALKAKNEFIKVISDLLIKRSGDSETYINSFDYVQWLLTRGSENELSIDFAMLHDNLFNFSNNHSIINIEDQKKECLFEILKVDIPVHLLVSLLSTWIICTNTILWMIVNRYRISEKEAPFDPNPLFLVRRARKDILIGKFLVPKNTYLSVCSSVSNLSNFFMSKSVSSQFFVNSEVNLKHQSLDKLAMRTSMNHSQRNISFSFQKNKDSIIESSNSSTNCHYSQETIVSNSISESTFSTSDIGYITPSLEHFQNFNNGTKDRIYPHQHLIRLIITTVSNHIASAVVINNKFAFEKLSVFYTARHLWFPIPSQPIFVSILPDAFVRSNID
ncbi:uncharacterized protein T551_02259 [Pneumocystis jirovecii RU7]|uniref:Cytochrome P450 n=1 Tax=Pneumocystis jirovecii (strain RU7) TaxID=1408657 RepID=A0A0W4ZMP5_PNEJ7|nr:uncharacterized protein T551_02259 [Pneumocystis jirovecii RU7]KTW29643.1 hypothetical protein T551_02259 [Pneumocystis jirovecii RU7]